MSKSFNRGLATLLAGALGLGAQHLASLSGEKGQPFVLGIFVFLLGILLIHVQTKVFRLRQFILIQVTLATVCSCSIYIHTIFSTNQS